ncbi:AAA domain-containing protein [Rhodococcoides corynebacterioides]|uniref:AAA domain-containing protein n=1 Tax=Rhodococcoides corynebacterioides TaxID=53972 RepID=UPI001C9ADBA1|nr:AAA domain-containing protein [Rhodococcus corynebacterioides]MBY6363243.1 AAA family ATPase [Rhodococcus corynebacterioides]
MADQDDAEVRGRVLRLLEFLRESVSSQSKPDREYGRKTRLEWLYRKDRLLDIDATAASGDVVVRIERVSVEPPPVLSAELEGHVSGAIDVATEAPTLSSGASVAVRREFDAWLPTWREWAREDLRRRPLAELFLSVDRMREESHAQPETVEVVLAAGLLSAVVAGTPVDCHLITQPVEIVRDDDTGDLLVRETAGSSPRLEDRQLLLGLEGLVSASSAALGKKLADSAASPLDDAVSAILAEWSKSAFRGVRYIADHNVPPAARRGTLRESPALVLRRRTGYALVSYYDAMIAALESGAAVPLGLQQLVESIDSTARLEWLGTPSDEPTTEALFPLPANRAQASIMEKLSLDTGVVVEGPPGTGKTHTIANLMSALLARGQRVLVTSEKSQALRVLRDKLPVELQDLCVSITDLAKGGSEELDHSISVIARRRAEFDLPTADRTIARTAAARYGAINKKYTLEGELVSSRAAESVIHTFGAHYMGTLSAIASKLETTADSLSWLPGPVYSEQPPLSVVRFGELARLLVASEVHQADRRQQTFADLSTILPSKAVIARLCESANARTVQTALVDVSVSDLRRYAALTRQILTRAEQLDDDTRSILDDVVSGSLGYLWTRARTVPTLLDTATAADAVVGTADVDVDRTDAEALSVFDAAARLYSEGRFDTLRWLRTPKEQSAVDALGANATVDGLPARGGDAYQVVAEHIRVIRTVDQAAAMLADIGIEVVVRGTRASRINSLATALRTVTVVGDLAERIAGLADELGGRVAVRDLVDVASLARVIDTTLAGSDSRVSMDQLGNAADGLDSATGSSDSPESLALSDALRTADIVSFESAVRAYLSASDEHHEQVSMDRILRDLDAAAPSLAQLIVEERETDWVAISGDFASAWEWRWARQQLEQHLTRPTDPDLDEEYDAVDAEILRLTASLAAESAWRACLDRMTSREMQALRTYQDSVRNVGAGRTRAAQRYRAAARTAMQEAQSAVPAWIMPIGQVLSSIPPGQNVFDVVIVDEASQANISSLFLMWLAPRVIVVGDDKQCAPDRVQKISDDVLYERVDTFLGDLPMHVRNNFTPRSSLFSLLRSRYDQRVRLREHFRSMPEIIEWSSKQFYRDSPLVPVRQFGADRLPPLRSTYVADGMTSGSSAKLVNQAEARQLVDQLCDCIADPDYDGMDFGVVVLQSRAHTELIRALIAERIPAEQRDHLRLRVGTPPEFQGDERDVMFVSMVVGPESSTLALTSELWQRRFNVAATRAKNQLWVFHSVTVEHLSTVDLRASLLSYVRAAPTVPVPAMPRVVDTSTLHPDLASMTAQRVLIALRDRGYHVNSSITINEVVLDLVVTGAATKLALECDDDRESSPEHMLARLRREMDLRRAGWAIARLRASDVIVDIDAALKPVVETLDALGILPGEVDILADGHESRWNPVVLSVDLNDEADPDDFSIVPAPTIEAPIAPLPVVVEDRDRLARSAAPETELEPGETRPPRFDGSSEIRVDSRYAPRRRSAPVVPDAVERTPVRRAPVKRTPVSRSPVPTRRTLASPASMPKRAVVNEQVAPPASPAVRRSSVGIEMLPAAVQAALASLPAAGLSTGRVIALAAARPDAPLTVRRCALVTGMTPIVAGQLLADLELTKKLVRRQRPDGVAEWVRPEDAAS